MWFQVYLKCSKYYILLYIVILYTEKIEDTFEFYHGRIRTNNLL